MAPSHLSIPLLPWKFPAGIATFTGSSLLTPNPVTLISPETTTLESIYESACSLQAIVGNKGAY